ncbi:NAD(P)H-binding protein [Enterococcus sp. AZ109]|uniref:NAD(P)H-binding protein n=1 Tax=Enterococcus sp. AZ109 TaxID=2774634 RepID=UPI003F28C5D3
MKILLLGAAGQVAEMVRENLLEETNDDLVLFARNGSQRIKNVNTARETVVDGDFEDTTALEKALADVDAVYLNDMGNTKGVKTIVAAMQKADVKKFVGASILGIYDEVAGAFGEWNNRMLGGSSRYQAQKDSAQAVEESGLNYTLLRLTWLYNEAGNENYAYTVKGEPFVGAEVTRQAVARLVVDILTSTDPKYIEQSLGVYEPGTEDYAKPTFY